MVQITPRPVGSSPTTPCSIKQTEHSFSLSLSVNTRFKWIKPKRFLTSFFTKKNLESVSDLGGGWVGIGGRV